MHQFEFRHHSIVLKEIGSLGGPEGKILLGRHLKTCVILQIFAYHPMDPPSNRPRFRVDSMPIQGVICLASARIIVAETGPIQGGHLGSESAGIPPGLKVRSAP